MVSTRGQKAKEENETALATQLSLAEQLQQASVSERLRRGLEEAILPQQGGSQHDTSLKDGSQEDVPQPIASRQDISAEARVEPDGNEPASDSIIVEHPDDKSLLSVKDVQHIAKAEPREGNSIKTANTDAKLFNGLAIRLKTATSSAVKIDEHREAANLSSLLVSDAAGHTLISIPSEKKYSRVYSLRSRIGESGRMALTDVEESNATADTAGSRDASEIDDDASADEKERVDGLTDRAKSVGTNVKDDDDYHPPVSGYMRRQRKVGARKATTQKATHHNQSVTIGPSSKNEGGYAFQQHNIIQDTLATSVTANQKSSRARGRKASRKSKL
jgi:hypothetical protein